MARADIGLGASVLITGAGPIGLCALLAARAAGATNILLSDPLPERIELAMALGATAVVNSRETDVARTALDQTNGRG